jgi:fengycin family lipopeptide synthetase E
MALSQSSDDFRSLERDALVTENFTPPPAGWLDRSGFGIFAEAAAMYPGKSAINDGECVLTYSEAYERAIQLGKAIVSSAVLGEPVGIALPNGASYIVAMLACLAAGCPYVPLDLSFPAQRNILILRHAGMRAIIVDQSTTGEVASMDVTLRQIDIDAVVSGVDLPAVSPRNIAFILYTSGSTGDPKGVYYDHRGLIYDAIRRTNCARISVEDRVALLFAPAVAAGQQDIFGALFNCATLHIVDVKRKGLQEVTAVFRSERITLCFSIPFLFRRLVSLCRDPEVFSSIRYFLIGGDRVFKSDIELFRTYFPATSVIGVAIGSTEANQFAHWFVDPEWNGSALLPVGYVFPGYRVSLVDTAGEVIGRGQVGEIQISSPYLARGYWKDQALTRQMFSGSEEDGVWRTFRSNDLAVMQPDGLIEFVGRADRQIKIRGNRVEPAEIEAAILAHSEVRDVAVIPRYYDDEVHLVAYVVRGGASLTVETLTAFLAERLPDSMRPRNFQFVPEIPMLGNFKHDIQKLKWIDAQRVGNTIAITKRRMPDRSALLDVRSIARKAWTSLLGSDSFETNRAWEAAGGQSLMALELAYILGRAMSIDVPPTIIGPDTRPHDLIEELTALFNPRQSSEQQPGSGIVAPTLFFLPGAHGALMNDVRLVQALKRDMAVQILDYPDISIADLNCTESNALFTAILTEVVEKIRDTCSASEHINLLGHSLGGFVAFEAARALVAEGRVVSFVGILDASPLMLSNPPAFLFESEPLIANGKNATLFDKVRHVARMPRLFRRAWERTLRLLIEYELRRQRLSLLSWQFALCKGLSMRRARLIIQRTVNRYARVRAMGNYELGRYEGAVAVFKARQNLDWQKWNAPRDLGWASHVGKVSVWDLPGDHSSLSDRINIDDTRAVLTRALARALA